MSGKERPALRPEPDRAELEALLARCARGEASALEALYTRVAPLLLAVLSRILKHRDLAEDALQDVFVKVWQQAGQYDRARGHPLAWLVSMARYRAIDLQRASRPAVALADLTQLESQLQVSGPAESAEALGARSLLLRCLERIAVRPRHALVLAYHDGLTHAEIARALGEPLGTVKSWMRRGLISLRECLES